MVPDNGRGEVCVTHVGPGWLAARKKNEQTIVKI
jgi:hypothetical protein